MQARCCTATLTMLTKRLPGRDARQCWPGLAGGSLLWRLYGPQGCRPAGSGLYHRTCLPTCGSVTLAAWMAAKLQAAPPPGASQAHLRFLWHGSKGLLLGGVCSSSRAAGALNSVISSCLRGPQHCLVPTSLPASTAAIRPSVTQLAQATVM